MTIDACVNRCVLFWKEFANEDKCPKCLAPRWKEKIVQCVDECPDNVNVRGRIRVPQLVLHHLPLIPRYSHNLAGALVYHETQSSNIPTQDLEEIFSSLDTEEDPLYVKVV